MFIDEAPERYKRALLRFDRSLSGDVHAHTSPCLPVAKTLQDGRSASDRIPALCP